MSEEYKRWIVYLLYLIAVVLFFSCNCSYHFKRIQKKCPNTFDTTITYISDTVLIPDLQKDTIIKYEYNVKDSIIFKDKTKVRYIVRTDTIELDVDCPDQIYVRDSVIIDRPIVKPMSHKEVLKKYSPYLIPFLLLLLCIIAWAAIKR